LEINGQRGARVRRTVASDATPAAAWRATTSSFLFSAAGGVEHSKEGGNEVLWSTKGEDEGERKERSKNGDLPCTFLPQACPQRPFLAKYLPWLPLSHQCSPTTHEMVHFG